MAPPLALKARALQWLAQREHSRVELRRKLLWAQRQDEAQAAASSIESPGVPASEPVVDAAAEIDALLDWLVEHRYLSAERFVESRVHARSARYGTRRIAHELGQHGMALDAATAEQLGASEHARARAVWQRRFGPAPAADAASRAKQMRFLAGRGFAADVIRSVVRGSDSSDDD